jgi:hypothetical protein
LAAFLISPAEAQVLQGKAVANATVRAFIWPNLTNAIATASTGANGRYTLQLPADATGKDIVVIAEKSVTGGKLRLSNIAADVPKEGKSGVDLDAVTTLAAEQIAKVAKNIPDLSPNAIAVILSEVQKIVESLTQLNLVVGAPDSPLPQNFGDGLQKPQQIAQVVQQVEEKVTQQQGNLPAPTGDVAIAKSIVQMLRDLGVSMADLPNSEVMTIQNAVNEQETVLSKEIQIATEFSQRINFPARVLFGSLKGEPPGAYREEVPGGDLRRVGDTDNRTWRVTSPDGMVLTVTVQNPIGEFALKPEAGKYTFQVRKPNDATIQYDGSIAVTTDAQGNPTQIALSATVKDSKLSSPITFTGTLFGTPAQTGTVTGSIRSPAVARQLRSRQSSIAPYTEAKFTNVRLTSQFGTAAIGELKVVWLRDSLEAEKVKQIALTNLNITTQTSKPVSLSVQTASVELQETTQEEKQQSGKDLKPKTATLSAMLEGSGLRLEVTNLQASDFVFVKDTDTWVPRRLSGQVRYTSPTLQFSGSVNAQWENLNLSGFGKENAPVPLAQIQKGSSSLQGNWTPKIGRPAGIQVNFTSNPTGNAPQVQMNLTINYGDQKLAGTITGTLDIRGNQSYGFKSGNLDMTHTPSNFKVQVSWERDKPVSGKIVTAQGQKVADIGEARNLGLPDLGDALIVKYSDNTFETLESVLPRSRLSRK